MVIGTLTRQPSGREEWAFAGVMQGITRGLMASVGLMNPRRTVFSRRLHAHDSKILNFYICFPCVKKRHGFVINGGRVLFQRAHFRMGGLLKISTI